MPDLCREEPPRLNASSRINGWPTASDAYLIASCSDFLMWIYSLETHLKEPYGDSSAVPSRMELTHSVEGTRNFVPRTDQKQLNSFARSVLIAFFI